MFRKTDWFLIIFIVGVFVCTALDNVVALLAWMGGATLGTIDASLRARREREQASDK